MNRRVQSPLRTRIFSATIVFAVCCGAAQGENDNEAAQTELDRRIALMQSALDDFVVTSDEIKDQSALKVVRKPLWVYDDESRNVLESGVWRVGEKGRPTAYITLELYPGGPRRGLLTYEFISMTDSNFTMISNRGLKWSPIWTELEMETVANAPQPAGLAQERLVQMQKLTARFSAIQSYRGKEIELRVSDDPIDRYSDPAKQIVDGAMFAFANGLNPELGMIVETDGKNWSYGLFRMGTAGVAMTLDGKKVHGIHPNTSYGEMRAYTATRHGVQLPE